MGPSETGFFEVGQAQDASLFFVEAELVVGVPSASRVEDMDPPHTIRTRGVGYLWQMLAVSRLWVARHVVRLL